MPKVAFLITSVITIADVASAAVPARLIKEEAFSSSSRWLKRGVGPLNNVLLAAVPPVSVGRELGAAAVEGRWGLTVTGADLGGGGGGGDEGVDPLFWFLKVTPTDPREAISPWPNTMYVIVDRSSLPFLNRLFLFSTRVPDETSHF